MPPNLPEQTNQISNFDFRPLITNVWLWISEYIFVFVWSIVVVMAWNSESCDRPLRSFSPIRFCQNRHCFPHNGAKRIREQTSFFISTCLKDNCHFTSTAHSVTNLYSYRCALSAILLDSQRVRWVLAEVSYSPWVTTKRSAQLIAVPVFLFLTCAYGPYSMSTEHPLYTLSRLKS